MCNESRKSTWYRLSWPKSLIAFIIDIVGYIIFSPVIFVRRIFHRHGLSPDSILLLRLDHMGDVLMATPAIIALKEKFPSARITVGVKEENRSLISLPGIVDKVVGLDAPWVVSNSKTMGRQWSSLLKKIREFRRERFDLAIDFKGDLRNIILLFLTGSKFRVSYGVRGGGFLLTKSVKYIFDIRHEIDRNLDIVRDIAGDVERAVPRYEVSPEKEAYVEKNFISTLFIPKGKKFIGIHPGANSLSKKWPLKFFAELAYRIEKEGIGRVVVFRGPNEDKEEAKKFFDEMKINFYNQIILSSDLDFDALAAFFKRLDLFIGNDSGPFHLAEAVGTKVIVIFGSTYPEIVGPISENSDVIKSRRSCVPCRRPGEKERCESFDCLKDISVEEVYKAVRLSLQVRHCEESKQSL